MHKSAIDQNVTKNCPPYLILMIFSVAGKSATLIVTHDKTTQSINVMLQLRLCLLATYQKLPIEFEHRMWLFN